MELVVGAALDAWLNDEEDMRLKEDVIIAALLAAGATLPQSKPTHGEGMTAPAIQPKATHVFLPCPRHARLTVWNVERVYLDDDRREWLGRWPAFMAQEAVLAASQFDKADILPPHTYDVREV